MGENKLLDCDSKSKKEDESRWVCFARSTILSFIITFGCCVFGLVYLYYKQLFFNLNNNGNDVKNTIFPTDSNNFFPESYFKDNKNKSGGSKCYTQTNKNINLTIFPYNLPENTTNRNFENWFANTIYESSKLNNKIWNGVFGILASWGNNSKIVDVIFLLIGWIFTLIFLCVSFVINIFTPWYGIIKSRNYFNDNSWINILVCVLSLLFGYPFILTFFYMIYYPLKLLYILSLKPFLDDSETIINIIKCNSSIIAYMLTLLIVVFGWNHLSLTVASIMTFVWILLFIKDFYNYLNTTFIIQNKEK